MRGAQSQANNAVQNAQNTATDLGSNAAGIGSQLTPFLTQEMEHPAGFSQQDLSAQTGAAWAGPEGANAGIVGQANQEAATTHNAGGFQAVLDDAARQRTKAAAGASEGIAANNANLKQTQQQEGAEGLQKLYGTDTSGMLDAMGQQSRDIDAETQAGQSGWLQQAMVVLGGLGADASGAGSLGWKPFGK